MIPPQFTCDGENLSPELEWSQPPEGARSFALIMDDPDAPGRTFTHWVLFDIPGATTRLEQGVRGIGTGGRNDFQHPGYRGPCPPGKHGDHRYFFKLYALDTDSLGLEEGTPRGEVERAMEGHVLAEARLMGRYRRHPG